MIIVPFSTLRWLSCSILVWEHHVAWAHSSVHEITGNLVERTWHLLIILHDWTTLELTFHALVWLTLSWHTGGSWLFLPIMLLLLWTTFHEMLLLRWLTLWRTSLCSHLLHHHGIHTRHLLSGSHSHILLLRWIRRIASSLGTRWTHWSLVHHLSRLLLRSSRLWLRLLHVLHLLTLLTYYD